MKTEIAVKDIFAESETQKHPLGTTFEWLSRKFIYSKADEALAAGDVLTPLATPTFAMDAVYTNLTAQDSLLGKMAISQVVEIADAGATVMAGSLTGMMLYVDDGLGEGQAEWIVGNTAGANGSAMKIYLRAALGTALTAAGVSDITIYSSDVVEKAAASSKLQVVLGVAPIAVTTKYYFWRQIRGLCRVLRGGTTTSAGWFLAPGDDTAGKAVVTVDSDDWGDASGFGVAITDAPADDTACLAFINCHC